MLGGKCYDCFTNEGDVCLSEKCLCKATQIEEMAEVDSNPGQSDCRAGLLSRLSSFPCEHLGLVINNKILNITI